MEEVSEGGVDAGERFEGIGLVPVGGFGGFRGFVIFWWGVGEEVEVLLREEGEVGALVLIWSAYKLWKKREWGRTEGPGPRRMNS